MTHYKLRQWYEMVYTPCLLSGHGHFSVSMYVCMYVGDMWLEKNGCNMYFGDYGAKPIGHNLCSRLLLPLE